MSGQRQRDRARKWRKAFAAVDLGELVADVLAPDRERGAGWAAPPHVDPSVATMQLRLRALGLYGGEADGRPSEALGAAVARFQRWAGLRATGDVHDPATRIRLRDEVRAAAAAGARPAQGERWPR